jgi:hypothetical protein
MDEVHLNPKDLLLLLNKQKEEAFLEEANGYSIFNNSNSVSKLQNKKYIKNWRKRHLRPFLLESDELEYISKLKNTDPMFDVKLALLGSKLLDASFLLSCSPSSAPKNTEPPPEHTQNETDFSIDFDDDIPF